MSVIILPAGLAASRRGTMISGTVQLGDPFYERAGVPNRRAAFIHNFTVDEIYYIIDLIQGLNGFSIEPSLPSDWRFPVPNYV
jgi:hypothetical protein